MRYQISNDSGVSFLYFDSVNWVTSTNTVTHVNTKADVEANIETLPVGLGQLKFKAIYNSDTNQDCEITSVSLDGTF